MKLFAALALSAALAAPAFAQAPTTPAQTPLPPAVSGGGAGARTAATPEIQAARRALRTSCATDIASLCADAAPAQAGAGSGGGGRLQCLRGHAAQLSSPCRDALLAMRDARKAAKS